MVDNVIAWNEELGVLFEVPTSGEMQISGNSLTSNAYAGLRCKGVEGFSPFSISGNHIESGTGMVPLYGIELHTVGDALTVESNPVIAGFHQAGILEDQSSARISLNCIRGNGYAGVQCIEGSSPAIYRNEIAAQEYDGLHCAGSSHPRVRWNSIEDNKTGVFSDETSLPDLGSIEDPGNNSVLLSNGHWVANLNPSAISAILNWWGTDDPDLYPDKFIGPIQFWPWLSGPPRQDGGQSARRSGSDPEFTVCGPNPSSGIKDFRYHLPREGRVRLQVRDVNGRAVRTLRDGRQEPGAYFVRWDGKDSGGRGVACGVYYCSFAAPGFHVVKKTVVSR